MHEQEPHNFWEASMPPCVYECFEPLNAELCWLCAAWGELVTISESDDHLALVNAAAPGFFHVVGRSLWDYVILGICRLADPSGNEKRPNMTLPRLIEAIDNIRLRDEIKKIFDSCQPEINAMSGHRNQRIAHNDFTTFSGAPSRPLERVGAKQVDCTLENFKLIVGRVEQFYVNGTTTAMYIPAGAGRLMVLLEDARDAGLLEEQTEYTGGTPG